VNRLNAIIVVLVTLAMLTGGAFARGKDDRKDNGKKPAQQQQHPVTGEWLKEHRNQPVQEQKKELEKDPHFQKLTPDQKQHIMQRLDHFNSLPPDRKEHVITNMERFAQMPTEQQNRAKALFSQFRMLPVDRKLALRQGFARLRRLKPQERQPAIESQEFKSQYSDSERDLLRGMTELNVGPAHDEDVNAGSPPPE
jgi:Protein of unknown function (DUF3106)